MGNILLLLFFSLPHLHHHHHQLLVEHLNLYDHEEDKACPLGSWSSTGACFRPFGGFIAQLDLQNSLVDLYLAECLPGPREVIWFGGDPPAIRGQGRGDKGRATRLCLLQGCVGFRHRPNLIRHLFLYS